jgi:hypothetical protein
VLEQKCFDIPDISEWLQTAIRQEYSLKQNRPLTTSDRTDRNFFQGVVKRAILLAMQAGKLSKHDRTISKSRIFTVDEVFDILNAIETQLELRTKRGENWYSQLVRPQVLTRLRNNLEREQNNVRSGS